MERQSAQRADVVKSVATRGCVDGLRVGVQPSQHAMSAAASRFADGYQSRHSIHALIAAMTERDLSQHDQRTQITFF